MDVVHAIASLSVNSSTHNAHPHMTAAGLRTQGERGRHAQQCCVDVWLCVVHARGDAQCQECCQLLHALLWISCKQWTVYITRLRILQTTVRVPRHEKQCTGLLASDMPLHTSTRRGWFECRVCMQCTACRHRWQGHLLDNQLQHSHATIQMRHHMRWFLSCVALQRAGADAAAAAGDQGDGGTGKRQDHVNRHEARHVIVMLLALPVAVQVLSHSNSATPSTR